MPLTTGKKLGAYEIVSSLGTGGMGEVYRARDPRLGRDVAVKVLPEAFLRDPGRLARFEREARTVAGLNHPNIVTLFSVEEERGLRFLTMELVEGRGLDQHVAPGGLPVDRVLEISIALADALVAAHAKGVVHRDLKPGNIMLTREGRVKVLDFGLAKPPETTENPGSTLALTMESPLTSAGLVVGTVPYMAPEQVRGEPADARTDLFAFGIIVYELATGRRPFLGASSADVSSAILRDTPEPASSLRPDLPVSLEQVLVRCLQKEPRARYQTALELMNDLRLLQRTQEKGVAVPKPAAVEKEIPSIAVLPFVNRSHDEEDEYFSDGLADELLNVLAKIRGLRVAARTSSFHFKGKDPTISEVGRSLNVATVLEGSVRKSGNRVRIAVQLVKVADGFHLWSETYDRTLEDIFAVQDDIAQSVVKELRTTLLGEEADSRASGEARAVVAEAAQGRGQNPEAYRLYLQARHLLDRYTYVDMEKGITYLTESLGLDPGNALGWVALSHAYSTQAGYGWLPVAEGYEKARTAVKKALFMAPDLAEAHAALCRIQAMYDFDFKGAEASCRRAMELAPGSPAVLRTASSVAEDLGRLDEAIELGRRAIEQDPLSSTGYTRLGSTYRMARRYPEALREFHKSIELAPQRISTHMMLSMACLESGQPEEALAEALLEPAEWARLTALACVHHAAGRRAESDQALEELVGRFSVESGYQIAAVFAYRGEREQALDWLEKSYEQRDSGIPSMFTEPIFSALRDDPRWKVLARKMGMEDFASRG